MSKQSSPQAPSKAETAARDTLVTDVLETYHVQRYRMYKINFFRGLFFGFGSVLGGTVLIAVAVWILGHFVHSPEIGRFLQPIVNSLQQRK